LGDLDGDARTIKWMLKECGVKISTPLERFKIESNSVLFWKLKKHLAFHKRRDNFDLLNNYQLINKDVLL
jgi:hypothetical protein